MRWSSVVKIQWMASVTNQMMGGQTEIAIHGRSHWSLNLWFTAWRRNLQDNCCTAWHNRFVMVINTFIFMFGFRGEHPNPAEKKSHLQPWLVRQQLHMAKQRTDCLGNWNSTAQHSCDVMCDNLHRAISSHTQPVRLCCRPTFTPKCPFCYKDRKKYIELWGRAPQTQNMRLYHTEVSQSNNNIPKVQLSL